MNKDFNVTENTQKNSKELSYKVIIPIILLMALISVSVDSYIYNLNEKSNKLSEEIVLIKSENENLELQISKAENVQDLMDKAVKDLGMKYASDSDYIKIPAQEDFFNDNND